MRIYDVSLCYKWLVIIYIACHSTGVTAFTLPITAPLVMRILHAESAQSRHYGRLGFRLNFRPAVVSPTNFHSSLNVAPKLTE